MNPSGPQAMWQPYGPVHWIMLALTAAGSVILVRIGRRHRGTPAARRFSRGFGWVILAITVLWTGWNLLPSHLDATSSIPLDLCNVLRFVSAIALISKPRWALAAMYYWGLTLDPQAMLTPSLVYSTIPALDFAAYWSQHMMVLWAAIYLVWGLGKKPDWRSYRAALLLIIAWAAVTFVVNQLLGANYGFLNHKPEMVSVLTWFGPWPVYLAVEFVAAVVVWALITLPWTVRRSRPILALAKKPEAVRD